MAAPESYAAVIVNAAGKGASFSSTRTARKAPGRLGSWGPGGDTRRRVKSPGPHTMGVNLASPSVIAQAIVSRRGRRSTGSRCPPAGLAHASRLRVSML